MDNDNQMQPPGDLPPEDDTTITASNHETSSSAPNDAPPPDPRYGPTPDMEAENPEAGAVPPGYDWPTHGGYLGCLLGMMPACLVGGFLGSTFIAWLNAARVVPPVVAGFLVVVVFALCVIGFGRLGWALGRRFYRKYPRGEPTWGEDDSAPKASTSASAGVEDEQTPTSSAQVNPGIAGEASGQATP